MFCQKCKDNKPCACEVEYEELTIEDYKDLLDEHDLSVRELDRAWNGKAGMAKQASLCDMVCQIEKELPIMREELRRLRDDKIVLDKRTVAGILKYIRLQREQARMIARNPLFEPGASTMVRECQEILDALREAGAQ